MTEKTVNIAIQPIAGSTQITGAGYDEATRTMAVRFTKGRTYHYADVPHDTFLGLLTAASAGGYFNTAVRGKFAYVQQA